jgi:hypothetical protein
MKSSAKALFNRNYQSHLKHLKLKGLQPKTIEVWRHPAARIEAAILNRGLAVQASLKSFTPGQFPKS